MCVVGAYVYARVVQEAEPVGKWQAGVADARMWMCRTRSTRLRVEAAPRCCYVRVVASRRGTFSGVVVFLHCLSLLQERESRSAAVVVVDVVDGESGGRARDNSFPQNHSLHPQERREEPLLLLLLVLFVVVGSRPVLSPQLRALLTHSLTHSLPTISPRPHAVHMVALLVRAAEWFS